MIDPYKLVEPEKLISPTVFSSPHSGRVYPQALLDRSRLSAQALRASEDAFVDQIFAAAPDWGAPLVAANFPRAYVDLNRGAEELDPALIKGVRATGLNPRIAAGLGVVPRIVAEGRPIYNGKLTKAEADERIAKYHRPYHNILTNLMRRAAREFGHAVLIDCHSMPSEALRAVPVKNGRRAEIIVGDRFGASAGRHMTEAAISAFEGAGFAVAANTPFAGGYITQRYGRPSQQWHAIQIEIDRSLYLDAEQMVPNKGFDSLLRSIGAVIPQLANLGFSRSLAAE
ncbi:MAG: N-formylglutamate amidohydrolase [Pikeienuella sp.]